MCWILEYHNYIYHKMICRTFCSFQLQPNNVVQASYLQVMIRTGRILADVAKARGYEPVRIDLFRTRPATATKQHLREEVLILRWPGNGSSGGRNVGYGRI